MENGQTDEWFAKLIDDKNFDPDVKFCSDRLFSYLESAAEDPEQLRPFEFLGAVYEYTRAFGELSSALSVGFGDITSKVQIWRDLFKNFYQKNTTIQSVMIVEVMNDIHQLNGENNSSLGQKKTDPHYTYTSGTRTLLRLSWFLDFLRNIFTQMINTKNAFNTCVTNAYEETLAPHHGWFVRKGASLGLSFAPSDRAPAMKLFFSKLNIFLFLFYSQIFFIVF